MKTKVVKIILIFAIALTIFNNYNVYAIKDPISDPDHYAPNDVREERKLEEMAEQILGVINTVGVVASVIILMVIGIKYMTGSVEEKAEYKNTMLKYVQGAALVFSATTLPNIIYKIALLI